VGDRKGIWLVEIYTSNTQLFYGTGSPGPTWSNLQLKQKPKVAAAVVITNINYCK